MKRDGSGSLTPSELRKRAEERLRETREQPTSKRPDEHDLPALVHELQVHQIELEMQNEALTQARDESAALHETYLDLYDFAPVGYFTLDAGGVIRRANLAGAALLGLSRESLAGRRLDLLLAPGSRPAFAAFLGGVIVGQVGVTCDVTLQREGGGSAHVQLAGEAIRAFPGCRLTMVDVSERRHAEDELKANEEKYRRIVETAHEGIWQIDAGSMTTFVNRRMAEMLGYAPEEMAGRPLFGFMTDEARVDAEQNLERGRKGIAEEHEFRFLRKDGSEVWTHLSTNPLSSAGEPYAGALAMVTEITERRRAEEALRQSEVEVHRLNADLECHIAETIFQRDSAESERDFAEEKLRRLNEQLEQRVEERTAELEAANREMEAFSFSVSHDLRAPLWAIGEFSELIVEDYGHLLGAEGEHRLDLVRSSVLRMVQLVDDLLSFSRVGRTEMRRSRMKMGDLARSAFEEVLGDRSEGKGIDFSVGELPEASGDPALMRQLWINLLSNAVKFSATAERPEIRVEGNLAGGEVVYSVRDNGVGFEMTDVDKLFGVFQRLHSETDFPGNGIGLSLVRRIVERHGGRVRAEGEVGKGATFRFTLGPAST